MKLFRQVSIWSRLDHKRAVRFNCVEDMSAHVFAVQSADIFTIPIKNEHLAYFEKLFPERFIEADWAERKWFESIDDAIAAFDREFQ